MEILVMCRPRVAGILHQHFTDSPIFPNGLRFLGQFSHWPLHYGSCEGDQPEHINIKKVGASVCDFVELFNVWPTAQSFGSGHASRCDHWKIF